MQYPQEQSRRRSVRLPDFDYAQASAYFVTICAYRRASLFGEIIGEDMVLSDAGQVLYEEWLRSEEIRSNAQLDMFQIMPNHFHAIVVIIHALSENPDVGAHSRAPLFR